MIKELVEGRMLPPILRMNDGNAVTDANWEKRRKEFVDILGKTIYGVMPEKVGNTTWQDEDIVDYMAAGKGVTRKVEITFPLTDNRSYTFPVKLIRPVTATADSPKAAFVFISFGRPEFYPIEEIVENDVIIAEMVIDHIALNTGPGEEDKSDNLLPSLYYDDAERWPDGFGKIGMWAFAASKVLDYLLTLDFVDKKHVGVLGHSRTGKTALWAGANDTRFTHVVANASGCMGAAITRGKSGETPMIIRKNFPLWFSKGFQEYAASKEMVEAADVDQHFLLASIAPRKLAIGLGEGDTWCDYISEYLSCVAASAAWKINGGIGFICPDRLPQVGDHFMEGDINFHLRAGQHFLSRHDWSIYCDFLKK